MAFSRVKAAGWAMFEVLTSAQMNQLDINMTKAVDGDGGGTYTPSAPIDIDGDGGGDGFAMKVENLQATSASATTVTMTQGTVNSQLTFKGDANDNLPKLEQSASSDPRVMGYRQLIGAAHANQGATTIFWAFNANSAGIFWIQQEVEAQHVLTIPLNHLPARCTITSVQVWIDGGTGHAGVPSGLPSFELIKSNASDGTATSEGSVTDSPGSVAAYESAHSLTLGGLNLTVDQNTIYYVYFQGEGGANAVAGQLKVNSVRVTCEIGRIGP